MAKNWVINNVETITREQRKTMRPILLFITVGWAWTTIGLLGMTIVADTSWAWFTESSMDDELLFIVPGLLVAGIGVALWIRRARGQARQLKDL